MGVVLVDTFEDAPTYEDQTFEEWDVETAVKDPQISADGDYIALQPTVTQLEDGHVAAIDNLSYEDGFAATLKHSLTYAHNYQQLQEHFPTTEDYTVDAPDIQVGVTLEDGRPWPYAMTERIRGEQYELYDDADASQYDPAVDEAFHAMNEVGRELAVEERAISYPHPLELEDILVQNEQGEDGLPTLYYVNAGSYLPGITDEQFEESSHVPGENTREAWYDPDSWPDSGETYVERPQ